MRVLYACALYTTVVSKRVFLFFLPTTNSLSSLTLSLYAPGNTPVNSPAALTRIALGVVSTWWAALAVAIAAAALGAATAGVAGVLIAVVGCLVVRGRVWCFSFVRSETEPWNVK